MKKPVDTKPNVWDTPALEAEAAPKSVEKASKNKLFASTVDPDSFTPVASQFDLEGLMSDFPTAKELEKFLYDRTGYSVDLKGRSNKFKYQTALDILNGATPDQLLINPENPYLDKNELIPVDELRPTPPPPADVVGHGVALSFLTRTFPHPDGEWKASGQKCDVMFRKYTNNVITYEVLGPIAQRAVGTRVNKYGKEVPERYSWVDPRTGELIIRNSLGQLTPMGTRLKLYMQKQKVNKTDIWAAWIDRDVFLMDDGNSNTLDNPWGDN